MERENSQQEPTAEEIENSATYFIELENAMRGYGGQDSASLFPPLDDLPDHLDRLKFAAGRLDHIPVSFWSDFYSKQLKGSRDIPHIPMQIVLWGTGNDGMRNFRRHALFYQDELGDFSWTKADNLDNFRDHAEQCFRIAHAYVAILKTGVIPKNQSPSLDTQP